MASSESGISDGQRQEGGGDAAPSPAERLLLVGTGALFVAHLPYWLNWLRGTHPDITVRVALTRTAAQFVSPSAIAAVQRERPVLDVWTDEPATAATHVELVEWADAIVVYPATLHFVSRFALGLADTPVLLAMQCTSAPIVVAPCLPAGALQNPAVAGHIAAMQARPNVAVAPTEAGRSAATGRKDAATPPALGKVLSLIPDLRAAMQDPQEAARV